jgi:hypothetical protein
MGGKSRTFRELLDSLGAADDRPRIDEYDALFEALRLHHPIPRTATPKVMRDGRVDPGGATVDPASTLGTDLH